MGDGYKRLLIFKQKGVYGGLRSVVGAEMYKRDGYGGADGNFGLAELGKQEVCVRVGGSFRFAELAD